MLRGGLVFACSAAFFCFFRSSAFALSLRLRTVSFFHPLLQVGGGESQLEESYDLNPILLSQLQLRNKARRFRLRCCCCCITRCDAAQPPSLLLAIPRRFEGRSQHFTLPFLSACAQEPSPPDKDLRTFINDNLLNGEAVAAGSGGEGEKGSAEAAGGGGKKKGAAAAKAAAAAEAKDAKGRKGKAAAAAKGAQHALCFPTAALSSCCGPPFALIQAGCIAVGSFLISSSG